MTPLQALDAAGPYLPTDSIGVMIASGPDGWEGLESYVFPLADGVLTPGSPGTARGLRDDLNDLFTARLGFGLMDLHTVVVGGNVVGVQVLAFGDIEFNSDLPTVESPAGAVYELPLRHLTSGVDSEPNPFFDPNVYILPLESPRGVALSLSPAAFAEAGGLSASADERLRSLIAEVEDRSPSTLFAIFVEDLPPVPTGELPMPDGLLLSVGPFLTATFSGAPEILDAIDEALADFFASARDDLQPILDDVDSTSLPEALVALYGHHLLEGFSAQLAPRRGESLLTYEVELSDRGWLSLVALAQLASPFMDQLRGTPGSRSFDLDEEFALIAVASQHIPAGSTIDPSMIEAAEIPYYELPYDPVFWFNLEYYLDLPLQNDVAAGQMLRESDFAIPTYHDHIPDPEQEQEQEQEPINDAFTPPQIFEPGGA